MIYTSRIGQAGVDITVKSAQGGARLCAPTWNMVMGYKNKKVSEAEYTRQYLAILAKNEGQIVSFFAAMDGDITLLCYCRAGEFCHRVLLARWLEERLGMKYGGER